MFRSACLILIATMVTCALQARGEDTATQIDLSELAPLQMDAGFEHAKIKANAWVAEATRLSNEERRPFKEVLTEIINLNGAKGFPVYISPDGLYRPDDGHHKVLAAEETIEQYKLDPKTIHWKVFVKADFRGKTWEEYGEAMQKLGVGHFPSDVLADSRAHHETVGQLFQRLPRYFRMMRNSPMRSATGRFYDSLGLEGAWLRPYSQFYVGENLSETTGLTIQHGEELSEATQNKFKALYFAPGSEAAARRAALLAEARPEFRDMVAQKINEAMSLYGSEASRALATCVTSAIH